VIERHETILAEYTDEHLTEWAKRGAGQAGYARTMLAVPTEYRQGVAVRAREMRGGEVASRYIDWDAAYRMQPANCARRASGCRTSTTDIRRNQTTADLKEHSMLDHRTHPQPTDPISAAAWTFDVDPET
jgi:hypothetical protein